MPNANESCEEKWGGKVVRGGDMWGCHYCSYLVIPARDLGDLVDRETFEQRPEEKEGGYHVRVTGRDSR